MKAGTKIGLRFVVGDQINGFSYSFSKTLTTFLRESLNSKKLYLDAHLHEVAELNPNNTYYAGDHLFVHPEVDVALVYLAKQMERDNPTLDGRASLQNVKDLIECAEKFLAIFEK